VSSLASLNETQLQTYAHLAQAQNLQGKVIDRIAPLAKANPNWFAVQICSEQSLSVGDTACCFPLMSVIKPFLLLFLLHCYGFESVLQWVGVQPSDAPFHSLDQLITDRGYPRNPMINSGAITLADKLPGATAADRCAALCQWLNRQSGANFSLDNAMLTAVRQSDRSANLALVDYLTAVHRLNNPPLALDTYEQICCLSGQVADLARLGQLLASSQLNLHRQIVNAVMLTCGLYEASGLYAARIGLPIKSGISGALLAIVPRQGAIACYSPALDAVGNPIIALAFIEQLAQELELSVFS
jgi:glutaminase